MKSIAVFCGSSTGNDASFVAAAQELGKNLAQNQVTLVYGGAAVGLMGTVADATLAHGGKVIGVLPRFFLSGKEVPHHKLTELILCDSMHERKTKMFELAEGFIALPGGFGTLEEVSEILTWQQLGLHRFPVAFLNVGGFYNHLLSFFNEMSQKELLRPEHRQMALFCDSSSEILEKMRNHCAPEVRQWITKSKT